jgi:7-carboxy-7-deazaguanine synthase
VSQVASSLASAQLAVRVSEIFYSLQGESSRVGLPTVFIRLTGCPLRCTWCDTEYAFSGGNAQTIEEVIAETGRYGTRTVCVTGGEPLPQKNCLPLLTTLCDAGFDVSPETSGALDISNVDPRVSRIMDLKAPGSGENGKNLWTNLEHLCASDEIKMVLTDRADYEWARGTIADHQLGDRCPVLLSPVQGTLPPATLADWILADPLPAGRFPMRFQLQLHKVLWGNMRAK